MVYAQDVVIVLDELEVGGVPGGGGFDLGEDGRDGGGLARGWKACAVAGENLGEGEAAAVRNGRGDL